MPEKFNPREYESFEELTEEEKTENIDSKELSPEIIKEIMEKVQDIDEKETGYVCINIDSHEFPDSKKIEDILKNGLLGTNRKRRGDDGSYFPINKENWAEGVRKDKSALVQFNIVGRTNDIKEMKKRAMENQGKEEWRLTGIVWGRSFNIKDSAVAEKIIKSPEINICYYSLHYKVGNKIFIIFDTSNFKDGKSSEDISFSDIEEKSKIYTKFGDTTEMGYGLSFRVAPRFFKGIVLKTPFTKGGDFRIPLTSELLDTDTEKAFKEADSILEIFHKLNYYLPIYDSMGNLLWPKQISYEEVKKFVEDKKQARDKDKGTDKSVQI